MAQRCLILLLLLVGGAAAAVAGSSGKIAGVIKDTQTGETLVGANVIIEGTTQGAATNIDGYYVILNIQPGTYTLAASAVGYNRKRIENVRVSIDQTTTIDFPMTSTVVQMGEEVVVTAERPMVQKDLTAKTAVVGGDQIAALPVTEVDEVLNLQAGFVGGSLRGGRSGEVAYWIDGVPVTDVFDGSQVVQLNKNLVQELQLVSGAFNAEYGQAMSGIVNIATKEGSAKFSGAAGVYIGQYLPNSAIGASTDTLVFPGLDKFTPTAIRNYELNVSGPLIGDELTFFVNGRYIYFDGWLKGDRKYNPWNISYTDDITRTFYMYRDSSGMGDRETVPMNFSERVYGQGKLTWHATPVIKLTGNYIYDRTRSKPYARDYYYNPDGQGTDHNQSHTVIAQLTHTLSDRTFYTLGGSWFQREFRHYLYDPSYQNGIEVLVPGAPRYVHPNLFSLRDDSYSFATGGTDLNRFRRQTITQLLKFDISSQMDDANLVKAGVEFRHHRVYFESITLQPIDSQTAIDLATDSPFIQTQILPLSSPSHDMYNHTPTEFSAYIQDKLEFKNFILNVGLRFDYFQPDGVVLNDDTSNGGAYYTVDDPNIYSPLKPSNLARSLEERQTYWYKRVKAKSQFSPRIGGSFPITDRGIVHFSYGWFFQVPRFELLYENPAFKIGSGTGNVGLIGNADLQPEQTINAEIGVQQQLTDDIAVDVTAYLRDVRNLTSTRGSEVIVFGGSAKYSRYINNDFGLIKGIVLTLSKKFAGGFSATVDYTYQVAHGSASDPTAARNAELGGSLPEVQLVPLNWDQRHTLNVTATYNARQWGLSAIGTYGSGFPYTPRRTTDITSLLTNADLKPSTTSIDLRGYYEFPVGMFKLVAFARVINLLDTRNEDNVFDDTGRAGFTTDEQRAAQTNPKQRINSLDQWYTQPTNFSEPRRIELGFNLEF